MTGMLPALPTDIDLPAIDREQNRAASLGSRFPYRTNPGDRACTQPLRDFAASRKQQLIILAINDRRLDVRIRPEWQLR